MNSPKTVRETRCSRPLPAQSEHSTGLVPGSAPFPSQAATRDGDLVRHLPLDALRRLDELDLELGPDVRATSCAAAASAGAEQVVAEERREEVVQVGEVEVGREAAAAEAFVAETVVDLAPLRAREDFVGLDDLLEPLLGIRRVGDVRVQPRGRASGTRA